MLKNHTILKKCFRFFSNIDYCIKISVQGFDYDPVYSEWSVSTFNSRTISSNMSIGTEKVANLVTYKMLNRII